LRGVRGEEGGDKGASVTTPAKMNVLDLFSGIGAFSLGLERAGFKTVAFCEINRFCRRVLAKHWPEVPIYDDVRTLSAEGIAADGIRVDVVCGGFPCTDISRAKMHRWTGIDGEQSGLWSEYARLIGELRPLYAIVENTADLLGRGFERILGDLAALGYDAEWHCITAAAVNAPHLRDRLWLVAYPNCERLEGQHGYWQSPRHIGGGGHGATRLLSAITAEDWLPEPGVCRVVDGILERVERTRALGNSLVPQIPELIGRAILAAERRP